MILHCACLIRLLLTQKVFCVQNPPSPYRKFHQIFHGGAGEGCKVGVSEPLYGVHGGKNPGLFFRQEGGNPIAFQQFQKVIPLGENLLP